LGGAFMASYVALNRGLDILELLAEDAAGLPLTAIAARLGLAKSATHRLLLALSQQRFVSQDRATQHYCLTLRVAALGFRFLASTKITEVAQPVLDRLAQETGELVRMTLVEGRTLTWVAKAQGARSGLRYDPDMGREVVLHATATGKAWLATLDEDEAMALAARGFATPRRLGPNATRSEAALRRQLRETRARGYGLVIEEGEAGTAAIASVIRAALAPGARVVGTVSVAGPLVRFTRERIPVLAKAAIAAARELTLLWPVRERLAAETALRASA
jgi:IclR family transcriptional regulator, acetate operon repressor